MSGPAGEGDTGLAAERTVLAWRRTAVAATALAALLTNAALLEGWKPGAALPLAAAVTMALLALAGWRRGQDIRHGRYRADRWIITAVAVAVAAVGCVAVAIAVLTPGA